MIFFGSIKSKFEVGSLTGHDHDLEFKLQEVITGQCMATGHNQFWPILKNNLKIGLYGAKSIYLDILEEYV